MINKKDYERLQEICSEVNQIMLENKLYEISITTDNKFYSNNTNSMNITTREYVDNVRDFHYGTFDYNSDKQEIVGFKYKWNHEDFIKEGL